MGSSRTLSTAQHGDGDPQPCGPNDRLEMEVHLGDFLNDPANAGLRFLPQLTTAGPHVWPLLLIGPSGTGKTSIALPLARQLASNQGHQELVFQAIDFCRRYANAVETNSIERFRQSILSCGCLLLDDLQEFKQHAAAQVEFATLLDRFRNLEKPVIATADEACLQSDCLSPRLRSRLLAGLSLKINPPGPDARQVLIRRTATEFGFEISSATTRHLALMLAVTYPRIRQFFVRLKTWLQAAGRDDQRVIDTELIENFLEPDNGLDTKQAPDSVIRLVAQRFKIRMADLKSNSRRQSIVLARGVAVYVLRRRFQMSYARIGRMFGGRDHSTIMHSYRRTEKMLTDGNHPISNVVEEIERGIRENALQAAIE